MDMTQRSSIGIAKRRRFQGDFLKPKQPLSSADNCIDRLTGFPSHHIGDRGGVEVQSLRALSSSRRPIHHDIDLTGPAATL